MKQELSRKDLEYIYEIIDQSYIKLPILYNSIKQIKFDPDFILTVNDYLNRLKSNIYKDLIRQETGKNPTQNLISLIRSLCKISYEQALQISNNSFSSKYAGIYTMTAIDYILQNNFTQKKSLFNYSLNEFISMWLHENLRIIQEDFSIIVENGREKNFFPLCSCIFKKFESISAINWKRLQIIQNYRLIYFDQLIKPTNIELEINEDFILFFGKPLKLTMKKSEIPITLLYSYRNDNELMKIDQLHQIFRKSVAKILQNDIENDHKLILRSQHKIASVNNYIKFKTTSDSQQSAMKLEYQHPSESIEMISKQNISSAIHTHQSSTQNNNSLSHLQSPIISIDTEINASINFLSKLAHSPSSIQEKDETSPLLKQLKSCLKENNIDPNIIIENIRNIYPQPSFDVKDSLSFSAFTRVLRKDLRKINCEQLNKDSQSIDYSSFQTKNRLKLPKNKDTAIGDNIDQNCISIEVIHDPSRCSSNIKSIASSKSINQQLRSEQRWYSIDSNENSLSKDCLITSNSLFCPQNSFDKNSYSITVEHNEEFR